MTGKKFRGGCREVSPVFVAWEILCRFGHVRVQVCRPWGRKIFPTSFWLKCPYLVRLAGEIESRGGVRELEGYISSRGLFHEWRKYSMIHQLIRLKLGGRNENGFMRRYRAGIFRDVMRGGVGGIRVGDNVNVKCLHLQAASYIGLGFHPAGEWLKSHGLCAECDSCLCERDTLRDIKVYGAGTKIAKKSLPRKTGEAIFSLMTIPQTSARHGQRELQLLMTAPG